MSHRPEIPNGDKYRMRTDLSAECAHLIVDLIGREFMTRTEGEGKNAISFTYSEVYEPMLPDDRTGESLPSIRVRRELVESLAQPVFSGQQKVKSDTSQPELSSHSVDAYTLQVGEAVDFADLGKKPEFDTHDMYSWRPFVTAIIEKKRLIDDVGDLEGDNFEEVASYVVYADNGERPDDLDLLKLIHLLQSIMYTAREAATYEPSVLPASSSLQKIGNLTTRNFGALDAVGTPCGSCIRADTPCIHGVSQDISRKPFEG